MSQHTGEQRPKAATPTRRRRLRKRTKTRGHGTLNYDDIDQVQSVDLQSLDIDDRSIRKEFGKLGQLPCPYRIYKVMNFQIPRWDLSYSTSINLRPGTYEVKFFLSYPFYKRLLGALWSKSVDIRISILNSRNGYAKYDLVRHLDSHAVETKSRFSVSEDDCVNGSTTMKIRMLSKCSLRKLQIQAILFKATTK